MTKVFEGNLDASKLKVGLVVSRFNELISKGLLDGALDCLKRHQIKSENVDICWVPGSFEIPLIAKKMAAKEKYDAIVCLGAVIRGGTPHFDYIASQAAKGVAAVMLETSTPIIFGILTTDSLEQALERAGSKEGNRGWQAALSAIELANLADQI